MSKIYLITKIKEKHVCVIKVFIIFAGEIINRYHIPLIVEKHSKN